MPKLISNPFKSTVAAHVKNPAFQDCFRRPTSVAVSFIARRTQSDTALQKKNPGEVKDAYAHIKDLMCSRNLTYIYLYCVLYKMHIKNQDALLNTNILCAFAYFITWCERTDSQYVAIDISARFEAYA
jgi:hypothetical protein